MKKMLIMVAALSLIGSNAHGMDRFFDLLPDWVRTSKGVFKSEYNKVFLQPCTNSKSHKGEDSTPFIKCLIAAGYDHPQCFRIAANCAVEEEKWKVIGVD